MRKVAPFLCGFIIVSLFFIYAKRLENRLPQACSTTLPAHQFRAPQTSFPFHVDLKTALVFQGNRADSHVLAAYQQILAEEGFAYELVPAAALLNYSAKKLKERYVALILPEEINQNIPPPVVHLLERYVLDAGGKILLGADAGAIDGEGARRAQGLFAALAGLQYGWPKAGGEVKEPAGNRYEGTLLIPEGSPLRKYFDPVLFDRDALKVFDCPPVKDAYFPIANAGANVLAYTDRQPPENACVLQKNYAGGGVVLSVNGSPGALKARENVDFVLRPLLKYFLLELVGQPRLVASPGGTAGLVLAVHVCSGAYFRDLDRILAWKLFSQEIPFSFFVTAGPDNDRPGDKRGVDVCNPKKGRRYVEALSRYGSVGAHGGWHHNYWAYHYNELSAEEKKEYIDWNYQALQEVTGRPVTDYAAPGGRHDPEINDFLAAWGTKAVSAPLAFHSPPTRAWFNGRQEKRFWLFGYTGTTYGTAFENMLAGGRKPEQIVADICKLIDALVEKREIRLLYFHPVSIARHPQMWRAIQSYILQQVEEGNLSVRTMSDFAGFLARHEKVRFSIRKNERGYLVAASCPDSLKEMTFALPLEQNTRLKNAAGLKIKEKNGWTYVTILKDTRQVKLQLSATKTGA